MHFLNRVLDELKEYVNAEKLIFFLTFANAYFFCKTIIVKLLIIRKFLSENVFTWILF